MKNVRFDVPGFSGGSTSVGFERSLGEIKGVIKLSLPFANLSRNEWERLANASGLLAFALVVVFSSYAVYATYGHDFRGYYAAARVALAGGDPYDYEQVAPALQEITGYAGNNPYYYPPWFALAMLPVGILPYPLARAAWIVLSWVLFIGGVVLLSKALSWDPRGWRRWLVWLSAFVLFGWVCLKFEQLGILMFFTLAWALWALKHEKDTQAGVALALLLTKPNITLLAFGALALLAARSRRKVLLWTLISLVVLTGVGTLVFPGWLAQLSNPSFGKGLTWLTDGPDRVVQRRRLCTLLHWLEGMGITGAASWVIYAVVVGTVLWLLVRSRGQGSDAVYWAGLGSALTLLITPYALLYDYTTLVVGQFLVYKRLPEMGSRRRWIAIGVLAFMFSLLLWVGPEYDGYWLALGMTSLLLLVNLERGPSRSVVAPRETTTGDGSL
jgi:hypothetical protein